VSVSIELSNLGPLRRARFDVADLTLLIGENNTGKTFLATVLHRVLDPSPFRPRWRHDRDYRVPAEVEEWVTTVMDTPEDELPISDMTDVNPGRDTINWARKITTETLHDYGANVRQAIAYAFGAEASRLRRRTPSRHAADCYLRISSSKPDWGLEIRFDSERISVEPPDPEQWLKLILRPDQIRASTPRFSRPGRIRSRHIGDILGLGSSPGTINPNTRAGMFTSWPRNAIHLPADRTGIMQSHKVLAGAAVQQSARAGIRPIEIETLPGTSADFLSLILEILDSMSRFKRDSSRFAPLVRKFEKDMRAEIAVVPGSDGMDAIMAVTSEGRFPMARTSSMLSELAPLLLVLKSPYHSRYVDHLTIDEPEAHLHPEMQVRVASFMATLVNKGVRIVLTTHSDFFVSQFNNMMRIHELSELSGTTLSSSLPVLDRSRVGALRFARESRWCVADESVPDSIDGVDESTFTDVMRTQFQKTAELVNSLLEVDASK